MSESLKQKTVKGVGWSFADNIANSGITFLVGLVLANILTPEEYDTLCRRYGMGIYEQYGSAPLRFISADLDKSIEFTRVYINQIEEKIRMSEMAEEIARLWLFSTEDKS